MSDFALWWSKIYARGSSRSRSRSPISYTYVFRKSNQRVRTLAYSAVWRVVCNYCGSVELQYARLAQLIEHETLNFGVVGSRPTMGTICLVSLMDKTEDFYSPALGSTPGRGTTYEFSSVGQSNWLRTSRSGVRTSQLVPCGLTQVRFRCIYRAFAPLTYNG